MLDVWDLLIIAHIDVTVNIHSKFMASNTSPADTRRNNNVIMTSKRRRNVILTL